VAVFLLLAFAGGGGLDLLGSDDSSSSRADLTGRVTRVVDGDTVKVRLARGRGTRTVRYIGVDTPESVKPGEPVQCFAKAASSFNERLVQGRRVRLEIGRERTDRYGRLLAYVYVRGRGNPFVNAELLRRGYARTLAIPPNTDRAGRFAELERRARDDHRGLWAACP
jgi:endonuclease YncB( thermonuclease family)